MASGNMGVYEHSLKDEKSFKLLELNPLRDFQIVFDHLEKLAELYLKSLETNKKTKGA
jgi:hypothetical protein